MNKPIEDFPNYRIDSNGNVWSIRTKSCKLLNPFKMKSGYLLACLHKNGKFFNLLVHRIVAQTFIPNTENKPFVCHKNDNPSDNRVENLFWGSQKDNMQDMISKGRKLTVRGECVGSSKLTEEQVLFILKYPKHWGAQKELSEKFNVSPATISETISGKKWKHLL